MSLDDNEVAAEIAQTLAPETIYVAIYHDRDNGEVSGAAGRTERLAKKAILDVIWRKGYFVPGMQAAYERGEYDRALALFRERFPRDLIEIMETII